MDSMAELEKEEMEMKEVEENVFKGWMPKILICST